MKPDVNSQFLIRASNGASVLCMRGNGAPTVTAGGARYETIDRPRRTSVVQWSGDDPYEMDVPILIDGWRTGTSIEADCAKINQMFQSQGDLTPPVTVLIDGALPVKGARWVITNIAWGDQVIWSTGKNDKGFRLRQDATLHLKQFVHEAVLRINKTSTGDTLHIVKPGETGVQIAAKHGVTTAKLKKVNGLRDLKPLKTGDVIKIPTSVSGSVSVDPLQLSNIPRF